MNAFAIQNGDGAVDMSVGTNTLQQKINNAASPNELLALLNDSSREERDSVDMSALPVFSLDITATIQSSEDAPPIALELRVATDGYRWAVKGGGGDLIDDVKPGSTVQEAKEALAYSYQDPAFGLEADWL